MQALQSPFRGLPPLLVPSHGPLPPTPTMKNGARDPGGEPVGEGERLMHGEGRPQGMKRFESPLEGMPALLAPVRNGNDGGESLCWLGIAMGWDRMGWCAVTRR